MSELRSKIVCRKTQFHSNQNSFLGIEISAGVNKILGLYPGLMDAIDLRLELFPSRLLRSSILTGAVMAAYMEFCQKSRTDGMA
jgi:hypothetical protein